MVVAGIALFVSLGGTSIAAVNYVARAGSVDGKSAVFAGASLSQAAGKLVATNRSGADKGRLPGKFVADVAKTSVFSNVFEVADNAPGAPQTVSHAQRPRHADRDLQRPEHRRRQRGPDLDDRVQQRLRRARQRRPPRRQRRRRAAVAANQTATSIAIGGSNTFMFHIERRSQNAIINGGVRQDGRGTPAATCVVFGVVEQILP